MKLLDKLLSRLGLVLAPRAEYLKLLESVENTQDDVRFLAHDLNLRLAKLGEKDE